MCLVKVPKPKADPVGTTTPKEPVYLHNRFLDGLGINSAAGRNSLRIDRGTPAATPPAPVVTPPVTPPTGPGRRWRRGDDLGIPNG